MPTPLHRKAQRTIEPRQLIRSKALGLPFPESDSHNRFAILDFVVQGNRISFEMQPLGQRLQSFPGSCIDQVGRIERQSGPEKLVPPRCHFELPAKRRSPRIW